MENKKMKSKKKNDQKFNQKFKLIPLFVFILLVGIGVIGFRENVLASPSMLCDFETGKNTNGPEGGGTGSFHHGGTTDPLLPVVSPGAVGTNYCIEYHSFADEEKPQAFYIDNPNSKTNIEEADGANRFSAWIKLPVGYTQGHDSNFHFGTYTRDPNEGPYRDGPHYYHYYNLPGSPYWTKIIANEHPCHLSGDKDEIPDNPTAPGWNYYDGFTRFYFHCKGYGSKPAGEWSWYIDEVKFYHEDEPENTISINAVSCSYFGEGHFQINWHGEFRTSNDHHYEVRYSTSPITNASYASATLAPGCSDLTKVPNSYSWVKADFTIPITTGTAYFAIKDLTPGYDTYVTRIDYPIYPISSTPDTTPPTLSNGSPTGTLSANTTSTTLSITTNENATCKYGTLASVPYDEMTNIFTTTGGTNHSTTITGLTNGSSYTYYIRCQDTSGNANTTDYPISFSIANPTPPTPTYTITNFISLITHWLGIGDQDSDVNNDGVVNARDLGIMMHYWK